MSSPKVYKHKYNYRPVAIFLALTMGFTMLCYFLISKSAVDLAPDVPVTALASKEPAPFETESPDIDSMIPDPLNITIRYGTLGTLCSDCRIAVFSDDLAICYGYTPCNVKPGTVLKAAITPCGTDSDLAYKYHFPSGVDNDWATFTVPDDSNVVIELEPYRKGAELYGYVTDPEGEPLAGATVTVTSLTSGYCTETTTTDSFGSYNFDPVFCDNPATLTVSKQGFLSASCILTSDELSGSKSLQRNFSVVEACPAFIFKLINKWDDERTAARLMTYLVGAVGDTVSVRRPDGRDVTGYFTVTGTNTVAYMLADAEDISATYSVSCTSPLFSVLSRSIRHGGTVELTSQPVGGLIGNAVSESGDRSCIMTCLYDADGRLTDHTLCETGEEIFFTAAPGTYTLISYAVADSFESPFTNMDSVMESLNNYYHDEISITVGHITDIDTISVPGLILFTVPDIDTAAGSLAPITVTAPASTASGSFVCSGTAPAGAEITIRDGDIVLGHSVSDSHGQWSVRLATGSTLSEPYIHRLKATSGLMSSEVHTMSHDASSPAVVSIGIVTDGIDQGTVYPYSIDSVYRIKAIIDNSGSADGAPSFTILLADGSVLTVDARRQAGFDPDGHSIFISDALTASELNSAPVVARFEYIRDNSFPDVSALALSSGSAVADVLSDCSYISYAVYEADPVMYSLMRPKDELCTIIPDDHGQPLYEYYLCGLGTSLLQAVYNCPEETYSFIELQAFDNEADAAADAAHFAASGANITGLIPFSRLTDSGRTLYGTLDDSDADHVFLRYSRAFSFIRSLTERYSFDRQTVSSVVRDLDSAEELLSSAYELYSAHLAGTSAIRAITAAIYEDEAIHEMLHIPGDGSIPDYAVRIQSAGCDLLWAEVLDSCGSTILACAEKLELASTLAAAPDRIDSAILSDLLGSVSHGTPLKPLTAVSAYAYEGSLTNRIQGAAISFFNHDGTLFDTRPYGQANPMISGPSGSVCCNFDCFGLTVNASGESHLSSRTVAASDPVALPLTYELPTLSTLNIVDGITILTFDHYVMTDTIGAETINIQLDDKPMSVYITEKGQGLPPRKHHAVTVTPVDAVLSPDEAPICGGRRIATTFAIAFTDKIGDDTIAVSLSHLARSANGSSLARTQVTNYHPPVPITAHNLALLIAISVGVIFFMIFAIRVVTGMSAAHKRKGRPTEQDA